MNIKPVIFWIGILFVCNIAYAQNAAENKFNVAAPSPNAASMEIYGKFPISFATGLPNISIPLHTIKNGSLSIPVSMSYHPLSTGIENHPGWVGLGWNLNCGGAITRTQNGTKDEYSMQGYRGKGWYYTCSLLNANNWLSSSFLLPLTSVYRENDQLPYIGDGQPDEFNFNFLDYSGSFFRDHTGSWKVKTNQNISFEIQETITDDLVLPTYNPADPGNTNSIKLDHSFSKFIITDQAGIKYEFGGDLTSTEFSRGQKITLPGVVGGDPTREHDMASTAWYLKKITAPTGESITLTYERGEVLLKMIRGASFNAYFDELGAQCSNGYMGFQQYTDAVAINPVYLKKIETPFETINLYRSTSNEAKYLRSTYTSYFEPIYSNFFDYNDLSYLQYTNIVTQIPHLPHKFQQLNQLEIINKQNAKYNKHVDFNFSNAATERLTLGNLTIFADGYEDNIEQGYDFAYNNIGGLPAYGILESDYWGYYNNYNYYVNSNYATPFTWRQANFTYGKYALLKAITFPTGGKTEFEFEGNEYRKYVSATPFSIGLTTASQNMPAGGFRIKKITSTPNFNAPPVVKTYSYTADWGSAASSGILGGIPDLYQEKKEKYYDWRTGSNGELWMIRKTANDNALNPISSTGGNIVAYSNVSEINADGTRTDYNFSNFDSPGGLDELQAVRIIDNNNQVDDYTYLLSSHDVERRLLLSQKNYSAANVLKSQTINTYNTDANRVNLFGKALKYEMGRTSCWITQPSSFDSKIWAYKLYYYPMYLTASTSTVYNDDGSSLVSTTSYEYDQYRNIGLQSESRSDGLATYKRTYYNNDSYYQGAATSTEALGIKNLFANYKIKNAPVATAVMVGAWTGGDVVGGDLFTYNQNSPTIKAKYSMELNEPFSVFNYVTPSISSGSLIFDVNYKHQTEYSGNLSNALGAKPQVISGQNRTETKLWDYLGEHIVASVKNAAKSEVAYSSFEGSDYSGANAELKNNWNFNEANIIADATAPTGSKVLQVYGLISPSITLPVGKKYKLSFWSTGPISIYNANGNGTYVPFSSLKTIGSWSYYEIDLNGYGNTIGINPESQSIITRMDELRLFPFTAQMETYTFDTGLGTMSSKCDVAGRILHYFHDGLGRLELIQDEDRNIVKQFMYKVNVGQ